jgi:GH25 family lysozyme M1 (1,4-beta-N-acetylmuramidase)
VAGRNEGVTLRAVDISNWQGEITPQLAACLRQQLDLVVVRASLESMTLVNIARQQIQALQAVGLPVHAYLWLYPSWEPRKTVKDAMREYGPFNIPWWWVDVEDTKDTPEPIMSSLALGATLRALQAAGRSVGVYTGAWFWNDQRYMDATDAYSHIPLWVAFYDGIPDLGRWGRFGGWDRAVGKQYQGSGSASLCGMAVDLDVFDDSVLGNPKPADGLPLEEAEQWIADDLKRAASCWTTVQESAALRRKRLEALGLPPSTT